MKANEIKELLMSQTKIRTIKDTDYLSTGSTLLNLACTDHPERGFVKGGYYWFVGDSSSGKTFFSMTCLAEAALNPSFKRHRFIYDGKERGALMNIERFFGASVAKRIEPPRMEKQVPVFSNTVEDMYFNLDDCLQGDRPVIYIVDSMDALESFNDVAKFEEDKKKTRAGERVDGTYGLSKPKTNSQRLRTVMTPLEQSGSILIIISQTRDNIGFGFEKRTVGGGKSLKFYANLEIWSKVVGKVEKTVRGKKRQQGVDVEVRTRKNRLTGKDRTVIIPIVHSFGIDDIGSCVDYLVDEGEWTKAKKGGVIKAEDLDLSGTRENLIRKIQEEELDDEVRDIVAEVWNEIEDQSKVERRSRYS